MDIISREVVIVVVLLLRLLTAAVHLHLKWIYKLGANSHRETDRQTYNRFQLKSH